MRPYHQDDASRHCEFSDDECIEPVTQSVRWILGTLRLCAKHAAYVRMVESEWDRAEADYLEQR